MNLIEVFQEIMIQAAALVRKKPLQIGHKAGMMDGGGAVHHRVVMVKDQAFIFHITLFSIIYQLIIPFDTPRRKRKSLDFS